MKIDKLDRRILAIISDNARIPFRDVAERCGVSRAAIHQHVQRMVERGVITGSGYRVNPKDLGYTTCTYIGVRCLVPRSVASDRSNTRSCGMPLHHGTLLNADQTICCRQLALDAYIE